MIPSRHECPNGCFSAESKKYFLSGFDRLTKGGSQLQALSSLKAINQRRAFAHKAFDHMLIIGLVTETVDIGRFDRVPLDYILIGRRRVNEVPMPIESLTGLYYRNR